MNRDEGDSMRERAEELQLDACLDEIAGAAPAAGLVERVLAASGSRTGRDAAQYRARWLTAAVLLIGVGVVAAVAWLQHDKKARPQPAVAPPDAAQEPQEPQQPQSPHAAEITAAIHDLEIAEKRMQANKRLVGYGAEALAMLDAALQQRNNVARPEVLEVLRDARGKVIETLFVFAGPVTLIADYSDNLVRIVDADGKEAFLMNDVFGAWDAEITPQKTLLITEFSVSRVLEVDRKGNVIWSFDDLRNPYDADRLPNGNTLIADTFGGRVIEVSPQKQIVWKYDTEIRPFDCDRLANGNTLIADVLKDRVIEVSPTGEIDWEVQGMNNVHDADRLPNGHTLMTLRAAGKVIEVDRNGKTVWQLEGLKSPGDADRLPNGDTLVAEDKCVREFDAAGKEVWRYRCTWAVEVNRYY